MTTHDAMSRTFGLIGELLLDAQAAALAGQFSSAAWYLGFAAATRFDLTDDLEGKSAHQWIYGCREALRDIEDTSRSRR